MVYTKTGGTSSTPAAKRARVAYVEDSDEADEPTKTFCIFADGEAHLDSVVGMDLNQPHSTEMASAATLQAISKALHRWAEPEHELKEGDIDATLRNVHRLLTDYNAKQFSELAAVQDPFEELSTAQISFTKPGVSGSACVAVPFSFVDHVRLLHKECHWPRLLSLRLAVLFDVSFDDVDICGIDNTRFRFRGLKFDAVAAGMTLIFLFNSITKLAKSPELRHRQVLKTGYAVVAMNMLSRLMIEDHRQVQGFDSASAKLASVAEGQQKNLLKFRAFAKGVHEACQWEATKADISAPKTDKVNLWSDQ